LKKGADIAARFIAAYRHLESIGTITSNQEAAAILKCTPQVVTEILKERMNPTITVIQNFCIGYGVSFEFLFNGKKPILSPHLNPHLIPHLTTEKGNQIAAEPTEKYKKTSKDKDPITDREMIEQLKEQLRLKDEIIARDRKLLEAYKLIIESREDESGQTKRASSKGH